MTKERTASCLHRTERRLAAQPERREREINALGAVWLGKHLRKKNGKYRPHQGDREIKRRLRQIANGQLRMAGA